MDIYVSSDPSYVGGEYYQESTPKTAASSGGLQWQVPTLQWPCCSLPCRGWESLKTVLLTVAVCVIVVGGIFYATRVPHCDCSNVCENGPSVHPDEVSDVERPMNEHNEEDDKCDDDDDKEET